MTPWLGLRPPAELAADRLRLPEGNILGLQSPTVDQAVLGELFAPQQAQPTPPPATMPYYSPTQKKFFIGGRLIDEDDAQSLVEAEALLDQPDAGSRPAGDFRPIGRSGFQQILAPIRNPSLGTLFTKGFGRGVDSLQLLGGYGLQAIGAEETGQAIVRQQVEDLRRTTPFSRQLTEVDSTRGAIEWLVSVLGEAGPSVIESGVAALAGGLAGAAAGGGPNPASAAGGALAAVFGKESVKQSILAAAKKYAAGEALDAAETKLLREAAGITAAGQINDAVMYGTTRGVTITGAQMARRDLRRADALLRRGRAQSMRGGAAIGASLAGYQMGVGDIYGSSVEGGDPNRVAAFALGIPYAAVGLLPEFVLASRFMGGPAARMLANRPYAGRVGREALKRGVTGVGGGAVAEGGSEAAQELLAMSVNPEIDFDSPEGINRVLNAFGAGAAVGGVFGLSNLAARAPANLLAPGQTTEPPAASTEIPPTGGPAAPPTGGALVPAQSRDLMAGAGALVPTRDPNVVYRPQTAIGQEQRLMLPPPGAVLQVEGQPDFVVDEFGNTRAATADDVVVGITRGFVPPTAPGTQGVLNVFPEGRTTTGELRGMMEQPTQPVALLQPEGVSGEVPTAQPDLRQDVLPLDTGLAPFRLEQPAPPPPSGTLAGNEQLTALQDALARRQAQEQQFADVVPQAAPEAGALDQRLAESEPFLDVMGTEGRLVPEPQVGVTEADAEAQWAATRSGAIRRSWESLRPFFRDQWIDALNGNYTAADLKQIKIDLAKAEEIARRKPKEPLRTVVTGAITPAQSLTTEVIQEVEGAVREGIITRRTADGLIAGLNESLRDDLVLQIAEREFVLSALQRARDNKLKRKARVLKKPKAAKVPAKKQSGARGKAVAERGRERTARAGTAKPAAKGTAPVQDTQEQTVQDVKADPRYKPTLEAIRKAAADGAITAKERALFVDELKQDGDFDYVMEQIAKKRNAAEAAARRQAAQVLKRGKAKPKVGTKDAEYAKLREEIEASNDLTADEAANLIRAVEAKRSSPADIRARFKFFEKGKTVTKVAPGEARGLRREERETEKDETPVEPVGEVTSSDMDYADLSREISAARDAGEIPPLEARVLQDMWAKGKPVAEINRALVRFKNANKGISNKQEVNRRDFLAGLAATIVIAAGVDTKAFAMGAAPKKMDLGKIIDGLSPTEAVSAALQWIADNSTSALERRIAAKLLRNGMGNTILSMQDSVASNLYGVTEIDADGRSVVTIYTPQGVNIETVLHELIHAYVQQRWAGLSLYTPGNKRLVGDAADRSDKLVREIQDLWIGLNAAVEQNFPSIAESAEWRAAFNNPDELLSWTMTNAEVQAFMRTIDPKGNPIKTSKNSMWEAFKKWVMELLGLKYMPSEATALNRILQLGEDLIDAGAAVRTGIFSQKMAKAVKAQGKPKLVNERRVNEMIDGMPSSLRDPVRTVTDFFSGSGIRTISRFGLRDQVLRLAENLGIKTVARFSAATAARRTTLTRFEQPYLKWAEDYKRLPRSEQGMAPGSVNDIIQRMTSEDRWAFEPDYFEGAERDVTVTVDDELSALYDRLSPEGKRSVREAFRLNYNQLREMQDATITSVASEYDTLIETAETDAAKEKLRSEKAATLARYKSMLNWDKTKPYAPLRVNGDWVVVGRSQRMIEAIKAGDSKRVYELEESPEDYFVTFAQTRSEAAKMARNIEGDFDAVQFFPKAQAEQELYGGGDVMFAFQKLESLLDDATSVEGADAALDPEARERAKIRREMQQGLRNSVANLKLQIMANNSIRKAELRRRGINQGHVDMVATTLSHGRSSAQFIASVKHNDKILDALRAMRREVKTYGKDREAKQTVYNAILGHYMAGLQPQPQNTLVDKATSFSSSWMLLFSPSYYLQQAMQNMMLTMPSLAARYGYRDTTAAFMAAYKQVTKAWVDTGLTGQLNLDLLDARYRPLAIFISESGLLDVGLDREMGSLTAQSGGTTSGAFEKATSGLRNLTRKLEAINRLSAAIATYELSRSGNRGAPVTVDARAYQEYEKDFGATYPDMSPLSRRQYAAALEALDVINTTHGDYSFENAPDIFRNPVGRVVLQFQKFRMIVAGLYVRAFYNAFMDSSLSPQERRVARRVLMFTTGHAAIMGGLIGSPAAAIFTLIYNVLSGDDEERGDMERDIREAVGDDTIANLLLRGVPSVAGVDMSGTLGLGNLLSVAPYADTPTDRDSFAKYVLTLTGPAIGGIGANAFDAVSLMGDGNYYKGLEKLMPRGIGAASRAVREQVGGETTRRGDVTTQAIDLAKVEAVWGLLGLQPIARVNRNYARDQFFKDERFYQDRAADIKRAYVSATENSNATAINALRLEWRALQDARRERGFKTQPMLDLVKAPREKALRERRTVGGVQFTPATEGRARQITATAGTAG
jgi:hypothetical protein